MIVSVLLLILGLVLVIGGADALVDGASAVARKTGVSEFVIGLLIVGFGTSLPELVVSVTGAIDGNSSIAIGNVIGSNVFNTAFILAISAMLVPVAITKANKMQDIPIAILAAFVVALLGRNGGLGRVDGIIMLLLFAAFIYWSFRTGHSDAPDASPAPAFPMAKAVIFILAGLAALVFGGRIFVHSAVDIAHGIGVSDKFIAITVLAMGTSLPELVTSIVAIAKKRSQMALGNILGSNVFNLLMILGVSALISPVSFAGVDVYDYAALILSIVLVWTSVYTGKHNILDRFDASILLLAFAAYMTKVFLAL